MLSFQPFGFEQRQLPTAWGTLCYATPTSIWPTGEQPRPPVIFLHSLGGGSSSFEWSKVYPAFATSHTPIAPDLIGWGDSAHPATPYTIADYLHFITALLDAVAPTPVWMVASSLTAAITIKFAIQHPQRVQGLFLVCPSGYGDFGTHYQQGIPAQLTRLPGFDQLAYTLSAANPWGVRTFLEQFLFAQQSHLSDEIVAAYVASAQQPNAAAAALSTLRGDLCFDLALEIPHLQVPTVLVWGEQARLTPLAQGQRLAQLNPTSIRAFHVIPNAGMVPHLEVPAIVTGLLRHYVS